jgi:hypothetical protein
MTPTAARRPRGVYALPGWALGAISLTLLVVAVAALVLPFVLGRRRGGGKFAVGEED